MAYFNQDDKKAIAPKVKEILTKHGLKGSLSVKNLSTVRLTIKSGKIKFDRQYEQVNPYWYKSHHKDNQAFVKFMDEVMPVLNTGNYDNSDIMTDYHDRGFYVEVHIGKWNQDYVFEG